MAVRKKLDFNYPRFSGVSAVRGLPPTVETVLRNLTRMLENLKSEFVATSNINFGDIDWTAISAFTNSWVNEGSGTYDDAGYMKVDADVVMLRGVIKSGVLTSAAFTLPAGYRPAKEKIIASSSNGAFSEIRIKTDGTVVPNVGSTTRVSLDGITFRADA